MTDLERTGPIELYSDADRPVRTRSGPVSHRARPTDMPAAPWLARPSRPPRRSGRPPGRRPPGGRGGRRYAGSRRRRRHPGTRKALTIAGIVLLAVVVGLAGVAAGVYWKLNHNIKRIDNVFPTNAAVAPRPPDGPVGAQDILLVGSDSRAASQTTGSAGNPSAASPIGQRSDTVMIVHIAADRKSAYVISIPRDSWVDIPGHGQAKINAAFSWGGPPLLIQTVEQLTGIHIDHYAEVDFAGFKGMIDAVGGIDINVPINSYDEQLHKQWHAGWQHMNGTTALMYARQRYGLPNGDFDRINHQHQVISALMAKALSLGVFSNPIETTRLLNAVTQSVSVDSSLSGSALRGLALSLAGLSRSNVHFMTVPVQGVGWSADGQSIVLLDQARDQQLYRDVRHDSMGSYVPGPSPQATEVSPSPSPPG